MSSANKESFVVSPPIKTPLIESSFLILIARVSNASINSSGAHPPPRATAGHLLKLSVPGVGHSQFYRGPGAGH